MGKNTALAGLWHKVCWSIYDHVFCAKPHAFCLHTNKAFILKTL
jgi:hypothetical protein